MCQKSGKTLIPIDKPQVYFVDVVKCVITEMTHLALPTAWNARRPSEPAHLNSVGNLIPPTDRPTDQTNHPHTLGQPSRAGVLVRWIKKRTEVQHR